MTLDTIKRRQETVALWRYQIIRPAADKALTAKQRGAMVRELAGQVHPGPFGGTRRISRNTLDRWITAWRAGGLDGLEPAGRVAVARTPVEVLDFAAALKKERPERTAAQIRRIITQTMGDAPSESTLLRHFRTLGLPVVHQQVFGRFEADFVGEIWVGDALHGPRITGRKTYLFAFLDDHSRYMVAGRWATAEDSPRLSMVLKTAFMSWGVPNSVYVDNGASFRDASLARTCARLGIRLIHSTPGRPQGRGKIERFFNTVTSQFLTEVTPAGPETTAERPATGIGTPVATVTQLNDLFNAWVQTVYHHTVNTTTGQTPAVRWAEGWKKVQPRRPAADQITEAFLWSATRTVSLAGTIRLAGNTYQLDPAYAHRKVEVVYDPYDLSKPVKATWQNQTVPGGTPVDIQRHSHTKTAKAMADEQARRHAEQPASRNGTGVDYLRLLVDQQRTELARAGIDYTTLDQPANPNTHQEETR